MNDGTQRGVPRIGDGDRLRPFTAPAYVLEPTPGGAEVNLVAMTPEAAEVFGAAFAAMSPWRDYSFRPAALAAFFASCEPHAPRWAVMVDGALAGAVVIHRPWLHGPYLQFLGLIDGYRAAGVGAAVLSWIEQEAIGRYRNLWLCVSAINSRAETFYRRHGYERAAMLDALVATGMDEVLMRKRLD